MLSQVRRVLKKTLSLSLACVVLVLLLTPLLRTEAEAASSYHIHHWHETYGGYREDYYRVYTGSNKDGEATFFKTTDDVFTNIYSGQDVRITFYRSYEATSKKADAFVSYLKKNSSYKNCYANWYYFEVDGYKDYYAYTIEGFKFNKSNLKISNLTDRNPFVSSDGTQLNLYYICMGDKVSEKWSVISKDYQCSTGIVIWRSGDKKPITMGIGFENANYEHVRRYCPNETW